MTLQEAFGELSDQKLINEHKKRNRTFLELTEAGEEALHFFIGQMNPEIRLQIDAYLKENKIKLRNESSIIADYNKRADGQYVARLVVKEMGEDLINIELTVPTESMADRVCARWHDKSSGIYSYIADQLLNDSD
jgi:hypothetical protein